MNHSPERRTLLRHLLTFSNNGVDGRYESSDREKESLRIQAYRRFLTEELRAKVLDSENNSYVKIKARISEELGQRCEYDEWMVLDAVAEILEERRGNVLARVTGSSSTTSSDGLIFTTDLNAFISRLWPEDNPPWIYPMPAIMWDNRIPTTQLRTHLARASGEAAKSRIRLLNLPLNAAEDEVKVKEMVDGGDIDVTLAQGIKSEWANDRERLARSANVLESFALACREVLHAREHGDSLLGKLEGSESPGSSVTPFVDVETALSNWDLDGSAATALDAAKALVLQGKYAGSITSVYVVLHSVLRRILAEVGVTEGIPSDSNPKDLYGILNREKPNFYSANKFGSDVMKLHGSIYKILETLREIRGNGATSHANEVVDRQQAVLCVHMIEALILYLNACMEDYRIRVTPRFPSSEV